MRPKNPDLVGKKNNTGNNDYLTHLFSFTLLDRTTVVKENHQVGTVYAEKVNTGKRKSQGN